MNADNDGRDAGSVLQARQRGGVHVEFDSLAAVCCNHVDFGWIKIDTTGRLYRFRSI